MIANNLKINISFDPMVIIFKIDFHFDSNAFNYFKFANIIVFNLFEII